MFAIKIIGLLVAALGAWAIIQGKIANGIMLLVGGVAMLLYASTAAQLYDRRAPRETGPRTPPDTAGSGDPPPAPDDDAERREADR